MPIVRRLLLLSLSLTLLFAFAACDPAPTGPTGGTGTDLDATVDGTTFSFTLTGPQTYDASAKLGRVSGISTSGTTTRALTASFISDIAVGSYPRVLSSSDITITYTVAITGGGSESYFCRILSDDCKLTLTSNASQIVDGTFSARLTNQNDTSKHVTITNGSFSAKLQ